MTTRWLEGAAAWRTGLLHRRWQGAGSRLARKLIGHVKSGCHGPMDGPSTSGVVAEQPLELIRKCSADGAELAALPGLATNAGARLT